MMFFIRNILRGRKLYALKIFSVNVFILIFLLGSIELIFGKWKKNFFVNKNYVPIPGVIRDRVLEYDARLIYKSDKKVPIKYIRDSKGYRSRSIKSSKPIVLTIGGSTTDQRYISEGNTWQDFLDSSIPEYDFINGGIDGQSSYGHLFSIRNWHSRELTSKNVEAVIFYIGINDKRLIAEGFNHNADKFLTNKQYIKHVLKENSFFANFLLKLLTNTNNTRSLNNYDILAAHFPREKQFLKKGKKYNLKNNIVYSDFYEKLFFDLISETKYYFPHSKIIVIQQQIPGCKFISENVVYERHPDNIQKSYCKDLSIVYDLQKRVFKKFENKKDIFLFPMYLESIIKDNDVYDYAHTNVSGSFKIAEYIKSIID